MTQPDWLPAIERRIRRWLRDESGRRWVVAVSGGSDSVALLRVLHALAGPLGLELSVAHLDHGVRGEASRADAAFVAELAAELGLPFDLGHWSPTRSSHFEADARAARHAFLAETARARGASVVALGHTLDDQAETILHRIVRGTGPHGLTGIRWIRRFATDRWLLRPVLQVRREALRSYLRELDQPYRDDASNADVSRTRARIRHEILPRLEADFNPRVVDALARLGTLTNELVVDLGSRLVEVGRLVCRLCDSQQIVVDARLLRAQPFLHQRELLRRLWRQAGWPQQKMTIRHWGGLAALTWVKKATRRSLAGGILAEATPDTLTLRRIDVATVPALPPPLPQPVAIPSETAWGKGALVLSVDPAEPFQERLDLDQIVPPLELRTPRPGDRFAPLGLDGHSQPLRDFLRLQRVPAAFRPHIPLLCDARGILWVVGHRIAHRARLQDHTQNRLHLRWIPGESG